MPISKLARKKRLVGTSAVANLVTTTSKTEEDNMAQRNAQVRNLCDKCVSVRDDPLFSRPAHLVHPVTREPMLFDMHGRAACPECGAQWRRLLNHVELTNEFL